MSKLAVVECGILVTLDGQEVELNSHHWADWLDRNQSFRYCPKSGNAPYTARKEAQYWYGYRKVLGKLHKRYIGKPEELTIYRLEEVGNQLNITGESRPKKVTEMESVTTSDEIEKLHREIERLQIQINQQNEVLVKAEEMNREHVELKNEHWLQSHSLRLCEKELQQVKADNERLTKKIDKLHKGLQIQVNYDNARDEYLASLKLGKQSPEYKRTKKHLDSFIAMFDKLSVATQQPGNE